MLTGYPNEIEKQESTIQYFPVQIKRIKDYQLLIR